VPNARSLEGTFRQRLDRVESATKQKMDWKLWNGKSEVFPSELSEGQKKHNLIQIEQPIKRSSFNQFEYEILRMNDQASV
jgi:hypothetical protein